MTLKRTVVLVYPKIDYEDNYKFNWTPFSVLALAGVLEQRGFVPVVLDQNMIPDSDMIGKIEPHLDEALCVGFSIMTGGGQIGHALQLAAQVRDLRPDLPLVWGGPHVSALPEQTAAHELVDIAVAGQGDIVIAELANAFAAGTAVSGIPGVYMKSATGGECTPVHVRQLIRKEDLPMYPWHLVQPANYIRDDVTINSRTFGYVSSQGCPYRCRFCYEFGAYNAWWSGFEAERIIQDIETLVCNFGVNGVKFYDADFFVKPSRLRRYCELVQARELSIHWAGSANPHDILRMNKTDGGLDLIRETGCTRILMGMESGSDRILELIDKRVTSDQLRLVARIIADYGIIGSFTFIVGFPGETVADLDATIDLIEYVHAVSPQHETRLHIFAPYPGTPLYEMSLEYGFVPHTALGSWSDYNYYRPQTPWVSEEMEQLIREYTRLH